MGTDIDWRTHVEITRREFILRYAKRAKQSTHDFNVLETELDNILEAANRAGEQKLYKVSLEMVRWLWSDGGRFLDLQGYSQAGVQLLTQALDAARLLKKRTQEEQVLGQLGRSWLAVGDLQTASNCFQEALRLARKIGNRRDQASHLGCLGQIYLEQGDWDEAEKHFQQALTLAQKISNRQLEGRLLGSLGLVMSLTGNHNGAIERFGTALEIAQRSGDLQGQASHLGSMGTSYKYLGLQNPPQLKICSAGEFITEYLDASEQDHYYREAIRCFERALDIADRVGDRKMKERFEANLTEVRALV
jgi:tetratricopeptide (TPR) repeat protein